MRHPADSPLDLAFVEEGLYKYLTELEIYLKEKAMQIMDTVEVMWTHSIS